MFACERCGHVFSKKCDLKRHLLKKKTCVALNSQRDVDEILSELYKEKQHKCTYCNKSFQSRQGLYHHNKKCTRQLNGESSNIDNSITNQECENVIMDSITKESFNHSHSHNTNTMNGDININVTINDFNKVNGEQVIDSDTLVNLIKKIKSTDKYYTVFQQVLEKIYFDEAHPENHCFTVPNKKEKLAHVVRKGRVQYAKKDQITNTAIEETRLTLHDKYEEDPSDYHILTQQTMNKIDDKFETDDKAHIDRINSESEITILNNREMVQTTWKDVGLT